MYFYYSARRAPYWQSRVVDMRRVWAASNILVYSNHALNASVCVWVMSLAQNDFQISVCARGASICIVISRKEAKTRFNLSQRRRKLGFLEMLASFPYYIRRLHPQCICQLLQTGQSGRMCVCLVLLVAHTHTHIGWQSRRTYSVWMCFIQLISRPNLWGVGVASDSTHLQPFLAGTHTERSVCCLQLDY